MKLQTFCCTLITLGLFACNSSTDTEAKDPVPGSDTEIGDDNISEPEDDNGSTPNLKCQESSTFENFNEDFRFDLSNASITLEDSCQVIDVTSLDETSGDFFNVSSFNGDFIEIVEGVWAIAENGIGYEFSEHTGLMTVKPVAHWMSGGLGLGVRFRPHDIPETEGWVMDDTVAGVTSIPDVRWLLLNLTDGAGGAQFLSPHSVLSDLDNQLGVSVFIPNERELFEEAVDRFRALGYKIMVYYAAQGPALTKHGISKFPGAIEDNDGNYSSASFDAWIDHVEGVYGDSTRATLMQAHAEIIFAEYAEKFGNKIDAWWFDQAQDINNQLHYDIAKQYNPNVVVSMQGEPDEYNDLTKGHVHNQNAVDFANLNEHIDYAERSAEGYVYTDAGQPNLAHYFSPIGTSYNGGDVVWSVDMAADWLDRMANAGGAWTFNFDNIDSQFGSIRTDMLDLVRDAQAQRLENQSNTSGPVFGSDVYDLGKVGQGDKFVASIAGLATDSDGDELYYALAEGPAWLDVAPDGTLSGTPVSITDVGAVTAVVSVGDGRGLSDFTEIDLEVINIPTLINVALGKTATQSTTIAGREASRALDGNTDGTTGGGSVTQTSPVSGSTWEVDLGETFRIYDIDLYSRTDETAMVLVNYIITISDENEDITYQQTFNDNSDLSMTIDVNDLNGVDGRYVEVMQLDDASVSLAEVEVYAAENLNLVNVALGKSATQSSSESGGEASNAVDGNTDGQYSGDSVTQTEIEDNPSWTVDLDGTFKVHEIVIYNRTEEDARLELTDFKVQLINRNGVVNFENTYTDHPDPSLAIPIGGINGDYVEITLLRDNVRLSLAEVVVYAEAK